MGCRKWMGTVLIQKEKELDMVTSARVEAVKTFASEHKDDEKWVKVSEMKDIDIYNIVKHTQSENGAIRKIARMIGSEAGANLLLHAPSQTTAQAEAERKLLEAVGVPVDVGAAHNPYDSPQGHAGHAPDIRPQTARDAVRAKIAHGTELPEDLQSHPGEPGEVPDAVTPKAPAAKTPAAKAAAAKNEKANA
jgi:hypothetical protein